MTVSKAPWTTTHGWIYDADGELVGICWGKTPEEAEENAQLASVAPEMIEAMEDLISLAKDAMEDANCDGAEFNIDEALKESIRILRKARGEE